MMMSLTPVPSRSCQTRWYGNMMKIEEAPEKVKSFVLVYT